MKTWVAALLVIAAQAATAQSKSGIEIFGHQIHVVDEVSQDDLMIDGVAALTEGEVTYGRSAWRARRPMWPVRPERGAGHTE